MENESNNINIENTIPPITIQENNETVVDDNTEIINNPDVTTQTDNNTDEINKNNTSNCLALTIKEDYKLTSKTNRILRSLRMSFKVFVSYVTLNIIKLFFKQKKKYFITLSISFLFSIFSCFSLPK